VEWSSKSASRHFAPRQPCRANTPIPLEPRSTIKVLSFTNLLVVESAAERAAWERTADVGAGRVDHDSGLAGMDAK
jgi:hypothetical protein